MIEAVKKASLDINSLDIYLPKNKIFVDFYRQC